MFLLQRLWRNGLIAIPHPCPRSSHPAICQSFSSPHLILEILYACLQSSEDFLINHMLRLNPGTQTLHSSILGSSIIPVSILIFMAYPGSMSQHSTDQAIFG
ncbi:hypothetical protein ACFX15_032122 [Malus domestica]